eukprot:7700143-Pyramimonas_sp.AAC.1
METAAAMRTWTLALRPPMGAPFGPPALTAAGGRPPRNMRRARSLRLARSGAAPVVQGARVGRGETSPPPGRGGALRLTWPGGS